MSFPEGPLPDDLIPGNVGHVGHHNMLHRGGGLFLAHPPTGLYGVDGPMIEECLADAVAEGAGGIRLDGGIYEVDFWENPDFDGYFHAIHARNGMQIIGAGKGKTQIRLRDSASHVGDGSRHIISNRNQQGGDEGLSYADFTIDGNSLNNGTGESNPEDWYYLGLYTLRTRGVSYRGIDVKNVFGDNNFPPGETFHIVNTSCTDVLHVGCRTFSDDGGDTGTGFSCNATTNAVYIGCHSYGMTKGMGYAHWFCGNISHYGCFAQLNGSQGFNSEYSRDILYSACHGGGTSFPDTGSPDHGGYPYPADESLGNGENGFVINSTVRAELIGCHGTNNTGNGVSIVNNGADLPEAHIIGGHYMGNGDYGLYLGPSAAVPPLVMVSPETECRSNGIADAYIGATIGTTAFTSILPGLSGGSIPGDDSPYSNPFPCDIDVYLEGGTLNFLSLGAANIIENVRHFRLRRGELFKLHYNPGDGPDTIYFVRS